MFQLRSRSRLTGPRPVDALRALQRVAEAAQAVGIQNAQRSRSATGEPLGRYAGGPRAGRPITLEATGRTRRSMRIQRAGDGLVLRADGTGHHAYRRAGVLSLEGNVAKAATAAAKTALMED